MSIVEEKRDNLFFATLVPATSGVVTMDVLSFVETAPSIDWSDITDQVLSIRTLDDDWDGEGSPAPKPDLVDGGLILLNWLRKERWQAPDRAIATVNGCVVFEWYFAEGFMEIEVCSPTLATGTFVPKIGENSMTFHPTSN